MAQFNLNDPQAIRDPVYDLIRLNIWDSYRVATRPRKILTKFGRTLNADSGVAPAIPDLDLLPPRIIPNNSDVRFFIETDTDNASAFARIAGILFTDIDWIDLQ